jgi:hypothetical protein
LENNFRLPKNLTKNRQSDSFNKSQLKRVVVDDDDDDYERETIKLIKGLCDSDSGN